MFVGEREGGWRERGGREGGRGEGGLEGERRGREGRNEDVYVHTLSSLLFPS